MTALVDSTLAAVRFALKHLLAGHRPTIWCSARRSQCEYGIWVEFRVADGSDSSGFLLGAEEALDDVDSMTRLLCDKAIATTDAMLARRSERLGAERLSTDAGRRHLVWPTAEAA